MNLTFCNTTAEYEKIEEEPLWHALGWDWTFHHFGLILSAAFGAFSIVLSLLLIFQHATHYSKPWEQRHVIRILFMIPIYSFVSFLSYYYYKHTIYFEVIRDCYEAFAIASFFTLLCHYTAPDLHGQKDYFRSVTPIPWIWPVSWMRKCTGGEKGLLRTPRSGLTWFNVIWFCVFQYCFIRVSMTIVAVATQATERYCLDSLSPAFAHVWVMVIEAVSVTIAMICLIQFYAQLRKDLADHQPFLKLLAIKLVVFLVFWQTIIINFLTSSDVIKPSPHVATPDVKIGIPAMLICLEMAFFSILHLWAYPWKVYRINTSDSHETGAAFTKSSPRYQGGPLGVKAYVDAFNPWDIIKAIGRSFRWIVIGRKTREQDVSYMQPRGTDLAESVGYRNKTGKYQPLQDEDETIWDARPYNQEQGMPNHAQYEPTSPRENKRFTSENFSRPIPYQSGSPYHGAGPYQNYGEAVPEAEHGDLGYQHVPLGPTAPAAPNGGRGGYL